MYRYLSSIKGQRETAEKFYTELGMSGPKTMDVDKTQLISDVRNALYASKICSYAQVRRGRGDPKGPLCWCMQRYRMSWIANVCNE